MASDARIILDIRRRCGVMLGELDAGNYHEAAARMSMVVDTLDKLVEKKILSRTPAREKQSDRSRGEQRSG
jgi:ribosomal protein S20